MLVLVFAAFVSARRVRRRERTNGLESFSRRDKAKVLSAALNVAALQLDEDEDEAPREGPLQRVIKMAVDNPLEDFGLENRAVAVKRTRLQRRKALQRAKQKRLQQMKAKAKSRKAVRLPVAAPQPAEVENVVKVESPFMMHDVMQPVQGPTSPSAGKKQLRKKTSAE